MLVGGAALAAGLLSLVGVAGVAGGVTAAGNWFASRAEEDELRRRAGESSHILGIDTQLQREQLAAQHGDTMEDVRRAQSQASGQIRAGAAASGVSASSGSVEAVHQDMVGQADQARERATRDLDFAMRGVDIQQMRGEYDIDAMRRQADEVARQRPWQLGADIVGMVGNTAGWVLGAVM